MSLNVSDISFSYTQGNEVISNFSLQVPEGKVVSLIGPSGCGKSTLLHCIAGLLVPSSGFIKIDGADVTHRKVYDRGIGIMMQDQPLYEHMTVAQNIAFPLRAQGVKAEVNEILERLDLSTIQSQKVSKCSGGERRRVAFGRAVVKKPRVLLLDEPFVSMQESLRDIIQEYIHELRITTLLVTHEKETIIDNIVVAMKQEC